MKTIKLILYIYFFKVKYYKKNINKLKKIAKKIIFKLFINL